MKHSKGPGKVMILLPVVGGLSAFLAGSGHASAALTTYTFTDLGQCDVFDPSSNNGIGIGISNGSTLATVEVVASSNGTPEYSFGGSSLTTLGTNGGTPPNQANAANTGGVVVGLYTTTATQAFYANTSSPSATLTSLPISFGTAGSAMPTTANGVNGTNSAFTVVGQATASNGFLRAYSWIKGSTNLTPLDATNGSGQFTMSGLGGPLTTNSAANAISTAGLIVGQAANTGGNQDGYLYSSSTSKMYDLGTGDGTSSDAYAINGTGDEIAGSLQGVGVDGYNRAFIYSGYNVSKVTGSGPDVSLNGTLTDLGSLDGTYSDALGVNAGEVVVGDSSALAGTTQHAFIYSPTSGTMTDLNALTVNLPLGWELDSATGINDAGFITGYADDGTGDGLTYAFLLKPTAVPEPSIRTVGAIAVGLASLRRRRV